MHIKKLHALKNTAKMRTLSPIVHTAYFVCMDTAAGCIAVFNCTQFVHSSLDFFGILRNMHIVTILRSSHYGLFGEFVFFSRRGRQERSRCERIIN